MTNATYNLETRTGQYGDTIVEFTYNDKFYGIITKDNDGEFTRDEIIEEFIFEYGKTDSNKSLINEVLTQLNK